MKKCENYESELHINSNSLVNEMKLVLLDNKIIGHEYIISALADNITAIIIGEDTYSSLLDKIGNNKLYKNIAFIFHGNFGSYFTFLKKENRMVLKNIKKFDPSLSTWNGFILFLQQLKYKYHANTIDFISCELGNYPEWQYIIQYIENKVGIIIRYANEKVGNPKYGGTWKLNNIDIKNEYFTNSIENYEGLFATAIEYGLIAALIAVVIITALTSLQTKMQTNVQNVGGEEGSSSEMTQNFVENEITGDTGNIENTDKRTSLEQAANERHNLNKNAKGSSPLYTSILDTDENKLAAINLLLDEGHPIFAYYSLCEDYNDNKFWALEKGPILSVELCKAPVFFFMRKDKLIPTDNGMFFTTHAIYPHEYTPTTFDAYIDNVKIYFRQINGTADGSIKWDQVGENPKYITANHPHGWGDITNTIDGSISYQGDNIKTELNAVAIKYDFTTTTTNGEYTSNGHEIVVIYTSLVGAYILMDDLKEHYKGLLQEQSLLFFEKSEDFLNY